MEQKIREVSCRITDISLSGEARLVRFATVAVVCPRAFVAVGMPNPNEYAITTAAALEILGANAHRGVYV
ncbi:MAG: hypothetical protein HKN13_09895 [Rhodothermales bacterium]|nr:hypothetical protein [Rhodothermales bacterium]